MVWHTQNFNGGSELSRGYSYHAGTLEYDASDYLITRAFIDRPAGGATGLVDAPQRSFNKLYEQEGGVPRYDRGIDTPLSAAASINKQVGVQILMIPTKHTDCVNMKEWTHFID